MVDDRARVSLIKKTAECQLALARLSSDTNDIDAEGQRAALSRVKMLAILDALPRARLPCR